MPAPGLLTKLFLPGTARVQQGAIVARSAATKRYAPQIATHQSFIDNSKGAIDVARSKYQKASANATKRNAIPSYDHNTIVASKNLHSAIGSHGATVRKYQPQIDRGNAQISQSVATRTSRLKQGEFGANAKRIGMIGAGTVATAMIAPPLFRSNQPVGNGYAQ